jgi:hypothetical protein
MIPAFKPLISKEGANEAAIKLLKSYLFKNPRLER